MKNKNALTKKLTALDLFHKTLSLAIPEIVASGSIDSLMLSIQTESLIHLGKVMGMNVGNFEQFLNDLNGETKKWEKITDAYLKNQKPNLQEIASAINVAPTKSAIEQKLALFCAAINFTKYIDACCAGGERHYSRQGKTYKRLDAMVKKAYNE